VSSFGLSSNVLVTDHLFWAGYTAAFYPPSTAAPCGFTSASLSVGRSSAT